MFPFGSGATPPNRPQNPNQNYPQQNPYIPNPHSPSAPGQMPMQMPMPFGSGMTGQIGFNIPLSNQSPQNVYAPQAQPNIYGGQVSLGNHTSPSFKNPTNFQPSIQNAYQPFGFSTTPQMQSPYQQNFPVNHNHPVAQNNYQSPQANYSNNSPVQMPPQSNQFHQNPPYANQNSFQKPSNFGSNAYPINNSNQSSYSQTNSSRRPFGSFQKIEGTPTVLPSPNFDAQADSAACRKAMKGFGTDEDGLIKVICYRTIFERQQIAKVFKTNFGKDLVDDIKSETRGNFENLLVACLTPTIEFYCKELNDALSGIGTDEDVLIETLCTLSNNEINIIKENYEKIYGSNLESALMSDTSGNFKRLLVSLCNASRDESGVTDVDAAKADATELLRAGELRFGTDESTFNRILCQRNYEQMKLICREYQAITGHSLEEAIKNEFSGDVEDGLMAIIRCVNSKAEFFAKQLHKSMAGLGTTDKQLIRIVVTRCEIDMVEIKAAFERMFGKSLKSFIKGDTSGDYKHALYALIGESRS